MDKNKICKTILGFAGLSIFAWQGYQIYKIVINSKNENIMFVQEDNDYNQYGYFGIDFREGSPAVRFFPL